MMTSSPTSLCQRRETGAPSGNNGVPIEARNKDMCTVLWARAGRARRWSASKHHPHLRGFITSLPQQLALKQKATGLRHSHASPIHHPVPVLASLYLDPDRPRSSLRPLLCFHESVCGDCRGRVSSAEPEPKRGETLPCAVSIAVRCSSKPFQPARGPRGVCLMPDTQALGQRSQVLARYMVTEPAHARPSCQRVC